MVLNLFGNFKEMKRKKAILEGDISPNDGECPVIVFPQEVDPKDVLKKLIRYYYLTDHQVPTGKIETSKEIPELEHEYVLPIRMKVSAVLMARRHEMREEIRKKKMEVSLGFLLLDGILAIFFGKALAGSTSGKVLLAVCAVLGIIFGIQLLLAAKPGPRG